MLMNWPVVLFAVESVPPADESPSYVDVLDSAFDVAEEVLGGDSPDGTPLLDESSTADNLGMSPSTTDPQDGKVIFSRLQSLLSKKHSQVSGTLCFSVNLVSVSVWPILMMVSTCCPGK